MNDGYAHRYVTVDCWPTVWMLPSILVHSTKRATATLQRLRAPSAVYAASGMHGVATYLTSTCPFHERCNMIGCVVQMTALTGLEICSLSDP